jgi:hypothetical protein
LKSGFLRDLSTPIAAMLFTLAKMRRAPQKKNPNVHRGKNKENVIYAYNGILSSLIKKSILPFATT